MFLSIITSLAVTGRRGWRSHLGEIDTTASDANGMRKDRFLPIRLIPP